MRNRAKVLAGLGLGLGGLIGVLLLNTLTAGSIHVEVPPSTLEVDTTTVARHLAEAVQLRTVSRRGGFDHAPFHALQDWVTATWPAFAAATEPIPVGDDGLTVLHRWQGSNPTLAPVVLLAHQDVVPIEEGTESDWSHPPFAGAIAPCGEEAAGDCVWGRGAIDMKAVLVGQLEAADALAREGFTPERTVFFLHTHDEEVLGTGAQAAAAWMASQNLTAEWVLDEGLVITDGIVPGVEAPVALIGIAEKGYLSVELIARGPGGHASMPPDSTPAGAIGRAVAALEANPFPAGLDGPAHQMFGELGPHLPLGQRLAFANTWLLAPIVTSVLTGKPSTNTLVRTTQAVTILEAGTQDNIIPQQARAVVNLRLHPRDSRESALKRMREVIDDPSIEIRPLAATLNGEPSAVSSTTSRGYEVVRAAAATAIPEAVVAPGLFIAASDSRHLSDVTTDTYRFQPFWMTELDRQRIHGTNERVRVDNLEHYVRFYDAVLRWGAGE